jgi:hypothetical protein
MIDAEVERLRSLRATALRVRGIARALQQRVSGRGRSADARSAEQIVLDRGACAAWRVARTVSGRLRAHPFAKYQKDASFAVVLKNEIAAQSAFFRVSLGRDAPALFGCELQTLARELADARALTWATELSDSFGRSQAEIGSLLAGLGLDARTAARGVLTQPRIASATAAGDWPYLAL